MNAWLLRSQWWVVGLTYGIPAGIVLVLVERFAQDESWSAAITSGGVLGLLCGGAVGALTTVRLREDAGGMPPDTYARVDRATRRGPVPADSQVRAAAYDLVLTRLTVVRASRTPSAVLMSGLAVLAAVRGVTGSPWWWVAAGVCVAVLVFAVLVVPRRLERRVELLAEPPS